MYAAVPGCRSQVNRKSALACFVVFREVYCGFASTELYCRIIRKESSRLNCQFHFVRAMWLLKMLAPATRSLRRVNRYVLSMRRRLVGRRVKVGLAARTFARYGRVPVG